MPEQEAISNGQRAYEEWHTEILSDPESREVYEKELRKLRLWHHATADVRQRRTRKVSAAHSRTAVRHALAYCLKRRK